MRILWTVAFLMATISVQAQNLEDVIYKKDGSVLRGTLTEQDFSNGRYKIQLQGGSLFSVKKDDIEKITKEAPLNTSASDSINIHIDNSPVINQNPVANAIAYSPQSDSESQPKSVFYIGSMAKIWMIDDAYYGSYGEFYTGLNLAYQSNVSKHIAIYTALNMGSISTYTENSVEYEAEFSANFRSIEIDALLSTNNYQGWQFYTGLGLFTERFNYDYGSESFTGTNFVLGLGYSWKDLQLHLRTTINNSSEYYDDETDVLSNLQLGFNF